MKDQSKLNSDIWVDDYGDALFHFALARVNDRETAEDLVQDTFLAAMQSRGRFKGKSSEKTWLFSILKHKMIDHYRKMKSTAHAQTISLDATSLDGIFNAKGNWQIRPGHWRADPGKSHDIKEFLDHFYRCLSNLPQQTADAFAYREIDGLSTPEICKRLDITSANCWVILYRARMLLRKCLELVGINQKQEENRQ
jgi:RNA polymerase sigma-70 factor (ECF subfamily)